MPVLAVLVSAASIVPVAYATLGGDGMIVVADDERDDVQVFHPNGTFAFKFGSSYNRSYS